MPKITTPDEFLCPITQELFNDPVVAADSYTYEREAIVNWLNNHNTSPMTNLVLESKIILRSFFVKDQIKIFITEKNVCALQDFIATIKAGNVNKLKKLNYLDSYLEANIDGSSLLGYAVKKDILELYLWLLEEGAKFGNEDKILTPLQIAASFGSIKTLDYLLTTNKFDIEAKNSNGETALYLATLNQYFEAVKLLLAHKAKANAADCQKIFPIHIAAENNNVDILGQLLTIDHANINANNNFGGTPLHFAVRKGSCLAVEFLLSASADPEIKDNNGKRPYDIAIEMGHEKIIKLIADYRKELAIQKEIIELNASSKKKIRQNKYNEAIKDSLKALSQLRHYEVKMKGELAVCYANLGVSYLKLLENTKPHTQKENKYYAPAIYNLKKALECYKDLNDLGNVNKFEIMVNDALRLHLFSKFTLTQKQILRQTQNEILPIHIAIMLNDFLQLQSLYEKEPKCLEARCRFNWSPLIYALLFKCSWNIIRFLVEKCPGHLEENYFPLPFVTERQNRIQYLRKINIDLNDPLDRKLYDHYFSNYGSEIDDEPNFSSDAFCDQKAGNLLDEDELFPPIFFALTNPKILKNISGQWNEEEFVKIVELLINTSSEQLRLLDIDDEEHCALTRALVCKAPNKVVELFMQKSPPEAFTTSSLLSAALASKYPDQLIETLIEKASSAALLEKNILPKAFAAQYPLSIIELIVKKSPDTIKKEKSENPALFMAIYCNSPIEIVRFVYEQYPEAALELTGADIMEEWDDDTLDKGYNVTSLILALYWDNYDIAEFLLQKCPILIHKKDANKRYPITYIDFDIAPVDFVEKALALSMPHIYRLDYCADFLTMLLTHKRKSIASAALELGFGIGANLKKSIIDVDTRDSIVVGMTIGSESITRNAPGFSHAFTNLEELNYSLNNLKEFGSRLFDPDTMFLYYTKLLTYIINFKIMNSDNLELKKSYNKFLNSKIFPEIGPLIDLRAWFIKNKPMGLSKVNNVLLERITDNKTMYFWELRNILQQNNAAYILCKQKEHISLLLPTLSNDGTWEVSPLDNQIFEGLDFPESGICLTNESIFTKEMYEQIVIASNTNNSDKHFSLMFKPKVSSIKSNDNCESFETTAQPTCLRK